jgi:hypothetical protein
MLDFFKKKKLGVTPVTTEASQEVTTTGDLPEQEKEETMSVEDKAQTIELAAHEAVLAQLATLTAEMDSVKAATEAMKAEYEEKLSAYAAAEEKAKTDALAAKAKARQEKAEAKMGTEKAAEFMAATEDMSDEKFDSFLAIFATNADAEANSELFNEVGVETKADAKVDEPKVEHFNKYLPKKTAKKETK